jgi:hypothetical protein
MHQYVYPPAASALRSPRTAQIENSAISTSAAANA